MKFLVILMSIVYFSGNALADIGKSNKIDSILSLSGNKKANEDLEKIFDAQSRNLNSDIPSEYRDVIGKAYRDNFTAKELNRRMIDALEKSYSPREIEDMYTFYNIPDIKRIARMEEESSGPDKDRDRESFMKSLTNNPPAKERVAIILNFFKQSRLTEQSVDIVMAVQTSLASATGKTLSADEMNGMRSTFRTQLEQVNLVNSLFIYKDLSNDELKTYYSKIASNGKIMRLGSIYLSELRNYCAQWASAIGKVLNEAKMDQMSKEKK